MAKEYLRKLTESLQDIIDGDDSVCITIAQQVEWAAKAGAAWALGEFARANDYELSAQLKHELEALESEIENHNFTEDLKNEKTQPDRTEIRKIASSCSG